MKETPKTYLDWLRDAYAMEEQALAMMRRLIPRLEDHPSLRERLDQHVTETEAQKAALRRLLLRAERKVQARDPAGWAAATARAMGGFAVCDEVTRGTMACYTFEHIKIASYLVLIDAARRLGDREAQAVFETNLGQECAMATWLHTYLDDTSPVTAPRDNAEMMMRH